MTNVRNFPSRKKPIPPDLDGLHAQVLEDILDQYDAALTKNRLNDWFISKLPSYALPGHADMHIAYLSLPVLCEIEKKLKMHVLIDCNYADFTIVTGFVYNERTYRNISERISRMKLNELNSRLLNIICCNTFAIRCMNFDT